jgi:5-methylthioadenosine/S-adenosylhomocysteine deaminase
VGERIARVGVGAAPQEAADEVLNGQGRAVLPGLVNTHAHSHSSLTRGSAEGLPLAEWLKIIEQEQAQLTYEQAYVGALATYAEALLSGTTCISDMCLIPEAALEAAQAIGIRAVIAPYVAGSKPFTPSLADTERLLQTHADSQGRVRFWCGLHELESCGDQQVTEAVALAARYGVGLHLHCGETLPSVQATLARTGKRPVQHLAGLGAITPKSLLAHCVWTDDSEQALLAQAGSHVCHCPVANLKLGSGIAPIPTMLARQVNVSLATDGAKANNNLDMFDVLKFTSLLHKGVGLNPALLPPDQVLALGTRAGAQALAFDGGELAPGKLADLVLVNLERLHLQPAEPETAVTNLVHAARGGDVDLVMVGGRILVRDGRLEAVDQEQILASLKQVGRALLTLARPTP